MIYEESTKSHWSTTMPFEQDTEFNKACQMHTCVFNFWGPLMSRNLNILHGIGSRRQEKSDKKHSEQQFGRPNKDIGICFFFSFEEWEYVSHVHGMAKVNACASP